MQRIDKQRQHTRTTSTRQHVNPFGTCTIPATQTHAFPYLEGLLTHSFGGTNHPEQACGLGIFGGWFGSVRFRTQDTQRLCRNKLRGVGVAHKKLNGRRCKARGEIVVQIVVAHAWHTQPCCVHANPLRCLVSYGARSGT
jgi:hypothetical protein